MGAEEHGDYASRMSVRVRMAPSPTGLLHIGNVRTLLFNWLFARARGRRVPAPHREHGHARARSYEATEQIQESLRWLGLDWDGEVTFQLDRHGATRARSRERTRGRRKRRTRTRARSASACPTRASPAFDDVVLGRIEVAERRARGPRPRPLRRPADVQLRLAARGLLGRDHARHPRRRTTSRTRRSRSTCCARSAPSSPSTRTCPNVNGADGAKLSKRHGAVSVDEFRRGRLPARGAHELPRAPRLGAGRRDDDHVARRARRALLARARRREPGDLRLREARLDERRLPACAAGGRVRRAPRRVPP